MHQLIPIRRAAPNNYLLEVDNSVSVGRQGKGFLFGGAGLGAAVAAMEDASGRPALWATAQYLSYVRPGGRVSIRCTLPSVGKYTTQARATLFDGDTEILTATAALGAREGMSDQWAHIGDVPLPDACPERDHWGDAKSISHRFRFRPARGYFGDKGPPDGKRDATGRLLMWMRPAEDIVIDRVVLAVIADFFSPGIRNATGRWAGGNSLDNTIRYCAMVPTQWVLCDIQVEAIANGIVHGSMKIFAEEGHLMAVASQSMILRVRD